MANTTKEAVMDRYAKENRVALARDYVVDQMAAEYVFTDGMEERQAFDLAAGYAARMSDEALLKAAGFPTGAGR